MTIAPQNDFHYASRGAIRPIRNWLADCSRDLLRPSRLFKIFLAGLVTVIGLGFSGELQGSLGALGAGETGFAYAVAGRINGGSLRETDNVEKYDLKQNDDTELQNYFRLDKSAGYLYLRDGLKEIDTGANPLATFPLRIIPLQEKTEGEKAEKEAPEKDHKLYVHIVDCATFLQLTQDSESHVPSDVKEDAKGKLAGVKPLRNPDAVEEKIRCRTIAPLVKKESNLEAISKWINWKAQVVPDISQPDTSQSDTSDPLSVRIVMLSPLRKSYLQDLISVYGLPPKSPEANGTKHPQTPEKAANKKQSPRNHGAESITEIAILKDRADPGMEIFRISESNHSTTGNNTSTPGWQRQGWIWLDGGLRFLLTVRIPLLVIFAVIIPLLVFLMRYQFILARCLLKPYLILLFGQIATMAVAFHVMGEGLVLWVGLFYTLLRVLQLYGMLRYLRHLDLARVLHVTRLYILMQLLPKSSRAGMTRHASSRLAASQRISRSGIIRPQWLGLFLRVELLLWSLNGVGLILHFLIVFSRFFDISPA